MAEIGRLIHQPVSSVFVGALVPVACAVAVCAACSGSTDQGPHHPEKPEVPTAIDAGFDAPPPVPGEAVHSMVLFGYTRAYLSHLASFEAPYDYQVLLEVKLIATEPSDPDPLNAYVEDKKNSGESLYTIVPESFEIEDLRSGTPKKPFAFSAGIYRGDVEGGGVNILDIDVQVVRVIHFRKLDASAPPSDRYRAILVGEPTDRYAVHYVGGRPSFEQIVQISGAPDADGLATAVDRTDEEPLVEKDRVKMQLAGRKKAFTLKADVDVYTNIGDLGD